MGAVQSAHSLTPAHLLAAWLPACLGCSDKERGRGDHEVWECSGNAVGILEDVGMKVRGMDGKVVGQGGAHNCTWLENLILASSMLLAASSEWLGYCCWMGPAHSACFGG